LFVLLQFDGRVAVCMLTCRMLQSKSRFSCIFSARGGDLLYNQKFWIWNYSFPFWAILPVKIFNSLEFLDLLTLPIIGGNFRCSSPLKLVDFFQWCRGWFLRALDCMLYCSQILLLHWKVFLFLLLYCFWKMFNYLRKRTNIIDENKFIYYFSFEEWRVRLVLLYFLFDAIQQQLFVLIYCLLLAIWRTRTTLFVGWIIIIHTSFEIRLTSNTIHHWSGSIYGFYVVCV